MVPEAFIQYLVHFHGDRDYFECHEILEEYWKETEPGNKESILVGFIQLAVSVYHYRRGNLHGALRTLEKAIRIFQIEQKQCEDYQINSEKLMDLLIQLRQSIKDHAPYKSINLPISNEAVLEVSIRECKKKGFTWGKESNLLDKSLIHRHSMRDRSDVILERKKALKKKQK